MCLVRSRESSFLLLARLFKQVFQMKRVGAVLTMADQGIKGYVDFFRITKNRVENADSSVGVKF